MSRDRIQRARRMLNWQRHRPAGRPWCGSCYYYSPADRSPHCRLGNYGTTPSSTCGEHRPAQTRQEA